MKIYFAHPINTYKTQIDYLCIDIIKKKLGNKIINPSDDFIQDIFQEYRKNNPDTYMDFFKNLVSDVDTIVYLPFRDGMIGDGIWYEVKCVFENNGKIFEIDVDNKDVKKVDYEYVNNKKLTIEETRVRIRSIY